YCFSSRRRHTRWPRDWSSDVCSSDLTGVLLAVTNRPIWADTTLLGLTFLISAASTSAALLILLGCWGGASDASMDALERFDASEIGRALGRERGGNECRVGSQ